jgi:hypothetical protein
MTLYSSRTVVIPSTDAARATYVVLLESNITNAWVVPYTLNPWLLREAVILITQLRRYSVTNSHSGRSLNARWVGASEVVLHFLKFELHSPSVHL